MDADSGLSWSTFFGLTTLAVLAALTVFVGVTTGAGGGAGISMDADSGLSWSTLLGLTTLAVLTALTVFVGVTTGAGGADGAGGMTFLLFAGD